MRIPAQRPIAATFMAFAAILACAGLQGQHNAASNHPETASPDVGKRTYSSACTSCHGLDGRGTERAPNIANSAPNEMTFSFLGTMPIPPSFEDESAPYSARGPDGPLHEASGVPNSTEIGLSG